MERTFACDKYLTSGNPAVANGSSNSRLYIVILGELEQTNVLMLNKRITNGEALIVLMPQIQEVRIEKAVE
jgi:hypothetical protein